MWYENGGKKEELFSCRKCISMHLNITNTFEEGIRKHFSKFQQTFIHNFQTKKVKKYHLEKKATNEKANHSNSLQEQSHLTVQ